MKFRLLSAILLTALCLAGRSMMASTPAGFKPPKHNNYKSLGGCNIPADQFDMDVNNVRARLLDAGDQWWDLSVGRYEVPKGDITSTTPLPQAIFAGAIWVSALDQGNNLKSAALEYRQGTSDYYTGPLDDNGNVSLATCNLWDQHFRVYATDIKPCILAYQASHNTSVPGNIISTPGDSNMIRWPGKGNPYLAAEGYNMGGILAPFFDANGDGIYNPTDGDYPTIKQGGIRPQGKGCDSLVYAFGACNPLVGSYADEMVFWVMNDKGNVHTASNCSPIGIQVNELAFAFQSTDEVNQMTFYTYNIINKSGAILHDTYMSQWTDVDLGCANNDRVGCDTSRSMAIQYNGFVAGATQQNGVTCDEGTVCPTSEVGYGCNLPMLGIKYFEGPTDTVTIYDSATHTRTPKKLGMTSFCYFTNGATPAQADPSSCSGFRNYQTGFWNDGSPLTYGGNGYGGSIKTNYCFPGDPSIANQWSECNPQTGPAIPANDRRFVQTSGPFTFLPCASEIITIGVIFVDPPGGVGSNCPSFSFLYAAADKAQALFDACFQQLSGPSAPLLNLRAMDQKVIINITDDPQGNNVGESYAQADQLRVSKGYVPGSGADSLYRFQGYILYQLANATVSSADLTDPTKAVPIVEYDIQDNVVHVVNYTASSDPITGTNTWVPNTSTIPGIGVNLANLGIQHSLVDSLDLIGGGRMVNHLTYYFGVLSFATNNFANFNAQTGVGQSTPFLIGKNFNTYSVIPENSAPTDGGRVLNSSYGTATQVKRIEGQANGGNYIDLDAPTIVGILNSPVNYLDTLDYIVGQDPLAFKVTDPILLKEADFELVIYDTVPYNNVSVSPKAWWVLNDLTNNVTIPSVSTLSKPYEQIIADALGNDYGFSLTLGTPFPVYTNYIDTLPVYAPIGGSITFADPSQPWLSFLKDSGLTIANHWIRSGSYEDKCVGATPDPLCNVFVSSYYTYPLDTNPPHVFYYTGLQDPNSYFNTIAGGTWAPYCLAANWSMGPNQPVVTGRPLSVGGPAFKWDKYNDAASSPENTLDQLQSVDIVLTSDKSKWSHCVVFETGDNPVLQMPNDPAGGNTPPRKGMLRGSYGLKIDSTPDPNNPGMSWFPGYAIDVETGERLNIGFGEASDEGDQNGRDMVWNPTSTLFGTINQGGNVPYTPIFGGKHFIYVFSNLFNNQPAPYDGGFTMETDFDVNQNNFGVSNYTAMVTNPTSTPYSALIRSYYKSIMWTAMPYLTPGYSMTNWAQGLIPNDVTIRLRVQKPYNKFYTVASDTTSPDTVFARYKFSTKGLGPQINNDSVAKAALDMIRIVPNPYLAYSAYETSANDAEVKVTNLPNNCTIKIYTLDGVLVRTLSQSLKTDPITNKQIEITNGYPLNGAETVLDNSIKWDLKNQSAIPISSGIYLFDINVPGVGHKILKWFGAVRPTDVTNF
jgi:hypothetical protein